MTWTGHDQNIPTPHEVRELVRKELESRDEKIAELEKEVDRWRTASTVVRWGAITAMGLISAGATVWDWVKEHIR